MSDGDYPVTLDSGCVIQNAKEMGEWLESLQDEHDKLWRQVNIVQDTFAKEFTP